MLQSKLTILKLFFMNETFSVHRELVLTSDIHLIQESNLTKFIRQTNVGPRCFTINIQLSLKWEKFYSTIRKKIRVVCILAILLKFFSCRVCLVVPH